MHFYPRVLDEMRSAGLSTDHSILVVCGGSFDAEVLREAGFRSVTISNLDEKLEEGCEPYGWARLDVEDIQLADGSVDWAICHAGLHHCRSPHRALLEMCRVARRGVIVLESRDSAMMRLATRLKLTVEYEFEAIVLHDYAWGGLRNGPVPNFIYRWTERDVEKTIESAYPGRLNHVRYFYGLAMPTSRLAMSGPLWRAVANLLGVAAWVVQRLFPKQCNQFAFAIFHTGREKTWMRDGLMRRDFPIRFDPTKYAGRHDR